ncbi:MAG: hypothetical protein GSR85_04395 [Desulfurococcales archaeon]|nr:hypothetical protein [Desulfurococcales archaeon]
MGIIETIIPYLKLRKLSKKYEELEREVRELREKAGQQQPTQDLTTRVVSEYLQYYPHLRKNIHRGGAATDLTNMLEKTEYRLQLLRKYPHIIETPEREIRTRILTNLLDDEAAAAALIAGTVFIPHPERITLNQPLEGEKIIDRSHYMGKLIDNYHKTHFAQTIHGKLAKQKTTKELHLILGEIGEEHPDGIRKAYKKALKEIIEQYGLPIFIIPEYEHLKKLLLPDYVRDAERKAIEEEGKPLKQIFYQKISQAYQEALQENREKSPHLKDEKKYTLLQIMAKLIPLAQQDPQSLIDHYEKLKPIEEALNRGDIQLNQIKQLLNKTPQQIAEEIDKLSEKLAEKYAQELQKLEEEKPPEEKPPIERTGARELLKTIIQETLPGWTIKMALDQAKTPLYTDHRGIHPSIIKHHIERSSPESEKGTLLHGLITKILAEWERQTTTGQQPQHPYQILKKILNQEPETYQPKNDEEARQTALKLGLPENITPKTLQKVIRELARDLKQLQEGQDPHQLDAEKEAAIRYHQLKTLANNKTPHPTIKEIIQGGKQAILQAYQEIRDRVLAETQLGREEKEKALNTIQEILERDLDKIIEEILKGKPISNTIAEATRKAEKELEERGIEDPQLRKWTVNFLRNTLLDAPIIAAARNPETQWKPLEEKQMIAAALLQLYKREGEKHSIAPVTPDLHWMWERIKNTPPQQRLEEIEKIREAVNAVGNVSLMAYKSFRPLLGAEHFNNNMLLGHHIINKLYQVKRNLMEESFPRIKTKRIEI